MRIADPRWRLADSRYDLPYRRRRVFPDPDIHNYDIRGRHLDRAIEERERNRRYDYESTRDPKYKPPILVPPAQRWWRGDRVTRGRRW